MFHLSQTAMTPGGTESNSLWCCTYIYIYINIYKYIYVCESSNVLTNEHSFFLPVIYSFLSVGSSICCIFFSINYKHLNWII